MTRGLIAGVLALCPVVAAAQVTEEWTARYTGPGNASDRGHAVVADADGNTYVAGYTTEAGGQQKWIVLKYSPAGAQLWSHVFAGNASHPNQAKAIVIGPDGSVYVTGYAFFDGLSREILTIKYDIHGNQLWTNTHGLPGNVNDEGYAIAIDNQGDIIVGGTVGSGSNGRVTTIKYAPDGTQMWVRTFTETGHNRGEPAEIAIDAGDNIYIGGFSNGPNNHNHGYLLLKYDTNGNQQWFRTYRPHNTNPSRGTGVALDNLGNPHTTGYSANAGSSLSDIVTIKYNSAGDQLWLHRWQTTPTNRNDEGRAIAVGPSGHVYVTGMAGQASGQLPKFITLKYDQNGNLIWERFYDHVGFSNEASAIALGEDESSYVTGRSNAGAPTGGDYATVKYDSAGNQQWVMRYSGPGSNADEAQAIFVRGNNIYVTGFSTQSGEDILTIRYSEPPPPPELHLSIQLEGINAVGSITRGIEIALGGNGGGPPLVLQRNVTFNSSGLATLVLTDADGVPSDGSLTRASAKDPLHTVRRTVDVADLGGGQYSASVVLKGGDANNDNVVDIVDYALFAVQFGYSFASPDTPIGTPPPHTDFSGDAHIGTADYSFFVANFLLVGDPQPGGFSHAPRDVRKAVTVRELLTEGVKHAREMDLNGDGWVTFEEITQWLFGRK